MDVCLLFNIWIFIVDEILWIRKGEFKYVMSDQKGYDEWDFKKFSLPIILYFTV